MQHDLSGSPLVHWRVLWAHIGLLLVAVAFSVLVALLSLTVPLFMLLVYDRVLSSRSEETLWALAILAGALVVGMGLLDYARRRILARFAGKLQEELDQYLLEGVSGEQPGRSGISTAELDRVRSFAHSGGVVALLDGMWIPIYLAATFVISPQLASLAVVGCATIAIVAFLGRLPTRHLEGEFREAAAVTKRVVALAQLGQNGLLGLRVGNKMMGALRVFRSRSRTAAIQAMDVSVAVDSIISTIKPLLSVFGLAVGAYLALNHQLTVGGLVAALILSSRIYGPFTSFLKAVPEAYQVSRDWKHLGDALRQHNSEHSLELPPASSVSSVVAIELRKVAFCGDLNRETGFDRLDLAIPAERITEIVGPSGSGKSLLAEVLSCSRVVTSGQVMISGVRINLLSPDTLSKATALVPEIPKFFSGTIAENIACLPTISGSAQVEEAAQAAGLHAAILGLSKGYGTWIGPDGSPLSRGMRDQVSLARALYERPRILVIDEPSDTLRDLLFKDAKSVLHPFLADGRAMVVLSRQFTGVAAKEDQYSIIDGCVIRRDSEPVVRLLTS